MDTIFSSQFIFQILSWGVRTDVFQNTWRIMHHLFKHLHDYYSKPFPVWNISFLHITEICWTDVISSDETVSDAGGWRCTKCKITSTLQYFGAQTQLIVSNLKGLFRWKTAISCIGFLCLFCFLNNNMETI